ncbi:MAG: hypothetical protein P8183_00310 [Anaerolineae bacterium]
MAKADIQIGIQNATEEFGALRFRPAEYVQGSVTVIPDSEVKCKHVYVRLEWHTEGRGTQFRQKVEELDVFSGTLQTGMPRSFEFSFQLPEEPWSYEGHYISIVWAIVVQLDVPWGRDVKQEEVFLLTPDRGEPAASDGW